MTQPPKYPFEIDIRNSVDHIRGMLVLFRNIPGMRDYDRQFIDELIAQLDRRGDMPDPGNGRAAGWYVCTGCGWLFYRTLVDAWCIVIDHAESRPKNWQYGSSALTWADVCEQYADCAGKIVPLLPPRELRSTDEA